MVRYILSLLFALQAWRAAATTQTLQPISYVKFTERVFRAGVARFLGVTPPEVPLGAAAPPPPGGASSASYSTKGMNLALEVSEFDTDPQVADLSNIHKATASQVKFLKVKKGRPDLGFNGINHYEQRWGGVGPHYLNTQYSIIPPDVALCVGNGFVLQTVNNAFAVYDNSGKVLAGPLASNEFFRLKPEINRTTLDRGDSIGDFSCVYDGTSGHFFISSYWLSGGRSNTLDRFGQTRVDPATNETYGAGLLLAVSSSGDPTKPWVYYFIPATNDGIHSHNDSAGPLSYNVTNFFGDYPQLGTDPYAVYITTNQFQGQPSGNYFGSNIYALSKQSLLSSTHFFHAVRFAIPWSYKYNNSLAFNPQPAKVNAKGDHDNRNGGTMYFVSSEGTNLVFSPYAHVALWALTNTRSLATVRPNPQLHIHVVDTPTYFMPTPAGATQKKGPTPLGSSPLFNSTAEANLAVSDGRVISAWYAAGCVWATFSPGYGPNLTTAATVVRLTPHFALRASRQRGRTLWAGPTPPLKFVATLDVYRELGAKDQFLTYPAVAVNSKGKGILAFTLTGPDYYPTAAYALIDNKGTVSDIYIAAEGAAPLDQFDGYKPNSSAVLVSRWGDYQTVNIDEDGNAWAITEHVAAGPRTALANWATFIWKIAL